MRQGACLTRATRNPNKALAKFLAKRLGTRASDITVVAGKTSRNKRIAVAGVTVAHVVERLRKGRCSLAS